MPSRDTVLRWMESHNDFSDQYVRARQHQADVYFDEIQDIADNATPQDVQVAKLRVDTLKWRLARMSPRKYGDRQAVEHSGPNGGDLGVTVRFVGGGNDDHA